MDPFFVPPGLHVLRVNQSALTLSSSVSILHLQHCYPQRYASHLGAPGWSCSLLLSVVRLELAPCPEIIIPACRSPFSISVPLLSSMLLIAYLSLGERKTRAAWSGLGRGHERARSCGAAMKCREEISQKDRVSDDRTHVLSNSIIYGELDAFDPFNTPASNVPSYSLTT